MHVTCLKSLRSLRSVCYVHLFFLVAVIVSLFFFCFCLTAVDTGEGGSDIVVDSGENEVVTTGQRMFGLQVII